MSAESEAVPLLQSKAYRVILAAGLIAGTLDITAACINATLRGRSTLWVLQTVASGLLGPDSYKGGLKSASLGLGLHFFIALVATTVFYAMSRKLTFLIRWAAISGPLYGIAVYLFMNLVVLPLALPQKLTYTVASVATQMTIHMVCVGLPIALTVRRLSK